MPWARQFSNAWCRSTRSAHHSDRLVNLPDLAVFEVAIGIGHKLCKLFNKETFLLFPAGVRKLPSGDIAT
jgi:hypothetical protein